MDWLFDVLDDEERQLVEENFALFDASESETRELIKAAANLADLEKRFISRNPSQLIDPQLRQSVLVCTVGLRELPVILSILIVQPVKVYLLHSRESRGNAERVRDDQFVQEFGLHPVNDVILQTISLTDAPTNYDTLRKILDENREQRVVVDISGGVKVMGVSLASAAFWLRVPVIYQLGEETKGIVRPFSETLLVLKNPFAHFGATDLRSIQELFQSGDYDAAHALARNLQTVVGDITTLGRLDILLEFIEVYRDWDAFAHSPLHEMENRKLAGRLRAVIGKLNRLDLNFADPEILAGNVDFLQQLEVSWRADSRSLNDRFRLVDIFATAQRRAQAGKYDDAVGRLYRCLEMSASIALAQECNLHNPKKPDLKYFLDKFGSQAQFEADFCKASSYPFPIGRPLGLKDQMTLLGLTGSNVCKTISNMYRDMEKKELLEKRNRSILAHGTIAVSSKEYAEFVQNTKEIVSRVVGNRKDFKELLDQATHPQLTLEL